MGCANGGGVGGDSRDACYGGHRLCDRPDAQPVEYHGRSRSIAHGHGDERGQPLYDSNSGPTIASVSINGTQVTVTGQALGSATVSFCAVGTASDCTNLAVMVQAGSVSGISFSQSNLSLSVGGSQTVTVSGGNGTYTISNNSNTSVVSTSLSGNALTVSGARGWGRDDNGL